MVCFFKYFDIFCGKLFPKMPQKTLKNCKKNAINSEKFAKNERFLGKIWQKKSKNLRLGRADFEILAGGF